MIMTTLPSNHGVLNIVSESGAVRKGGPASRHRVGELALIV